MLPLNGYLKTPEFVLKFNCYFSSGCDFTYRKAMRIIIARFWEHYIDPIAQNCTRNHENIILNELIIYFHINIYSFYLNSYHVSALYTLEARYGVDSTLIDTSSFWESCDRYTLWNKTVRPKPRGLKTRYCAVKYYRCIKYLKHFL